MKDESDKKDLLLDTKKTKIVVIEKDRDDGDLDTDGEKIEEVQSLKSLNLPA